MGATFYLMLFGVLLCMGELMLANLLLTMKRKKAGGPRLPGALPVEDAEMSAEDRDEAINRSSGSFIRLMAAILVMQLILMVLFFTGQMATLPVWLGTLYWLICSLGGIIMGILSTLRLRRVTVFGQAIAWIGIFQLIFLLLMFLISSM